MSSPSFPASGSNFFFANIYAALSASFALILTIGQSAD
jgi:hypothetical protein